MPFKPRHVCSLPIGDTSGLPRLPPNASWSQKFCRKLRLLFLMNPNHFKCKKLFRNKSSVIAERKRHAKSPYSLVIHPLSTIDTVVEVLFVIVWLFTIFCDPVLVFTESFNKVFMKLHAYVVPPIRILLIVILFNVGYIDEKNKRVVIEPKKIILRYLRTYFFFDIMASVYLLHLLVIMSKKGWIKCSPSHIKDSICYEILHLIRLLCCCVRINTLLTFMMDTLANLRIGKLTRTLVIYFVRTYIYLHLLASFLYQVPFFFHRGDWPSKSWLAQAGMRHNEHVVFHYFECLILAICHFFGISYKYNIQLLEEQICVIFITIFGRLYTLYLLADILNVFDVVGISESMYEKQLALLKQYMAAKELPENLRSRMLKYYEFKFQKRYFNEAEIISTLSEHLRTELFLFAARKLVQKVDFFKKLPNASIGIIVAAMKSETYSPRDVIVALASRVDEIFFISTGTVALISKKGVELCHLEDGEEFGTSCLIFREQMFTVVAVETTEVFTISKKQFLEFLEPHPEVLSVFLNTVKAKHNKLREMEHKLKDTAGRFDLLDNLQSGNILEKRTRKLVAHQ